MTDIRAAVLPKPFAFAEEKSQFFKLALRGALLQLPTFGFYRFWLTTDIRRHLWSHTSIDGDALEYVGLARELLMGFLFAAAILGPVYFAYFLLGVEAERLRAFASTPLVIFLYTFSQFAAYRGRRYRLTRTIWRGLRFSMQGSGLSYAWRSALWALATVLTVGLAYPWRAAALERFKMRNATYGDQAGDFTGTGQQLLDRAGWIWLICFVLVVANVMTIVLSTPRFGGNHSLDLLKPLLFVSGLVALPLLFATFKAREWRWWAENLRFDETGFSCTMSTPAYIVLMLKFFGALAGIIVAGVGLIGVALVLVAHPAGQPGGKIAFETFTAGQWAPIALIYLVMLACIGLAQRYFLQYRFWALIMSSLGALRIETVAAQRVEVASALGEGLADGLDFGF